MSNSIGTFFWLSFIFMFVKLKTDMPKHGYVLFFLIILIFMYFINVTILQERCGNVRTITVLQATLIPWLLIFANMMFILGKFPWWLTPFSNTFGLLFAKLGGCNAAFLAILYPEIPQSQPLLTPESLKVVSGKIYELKPNSTITSDQLDGTHKIINLMNKNPGQFKEIFTPEKTNSIIDSIRNNFPDMSKDQLETQFNYTVALIRSRLPPLPNDDQRQLNTTLRYVYSDPALLINKFTTENFNMTIQKLNHIVDISKIKEIEKFKQFVKLKEVVSEWIWYILTASITISISYNTLMASKCTKTAEQYMDTHNNTMADTPEEKVKPTVYTLS